MRSSLVLLVLLAGGSAHAMGSDRLSNLIAWNRDGSAALIENTTFRDGDKSLGYSVIAVGKPETGFSISFTIRDDGKDVEKIANAECATNARRLAADLAAAHFDGVVVRPASCKDIREHVVAVTPAATREVERSWVALAQGRAPTARETQSWELATFVKPDYKPFIPDTSCKDSNITLDVANATGKLILVLSSWTCNNPIRVTVHAFEQKGGSYVEQGGD